MNVLITGANGQLGAALQRILPQKVDAKLHFVDHSKLDITDGESVSRFITDNDISHIVNCAAYTNVDRAEEEKAACSAINSEGVKTLAMAADSYGAKIIHISTDYVFDGHSYKPYNESDKVNPASHYGSSKRAGETALLALAPESIIIRTSWLYGSDRQNNFVQRILAKAHDGEELRVVADQIGSPTFTDDLANAIAKILATPQWFSGVYHYCNAGVCSRYDFAKAILDLSGNGSVKISPISTDTNFLNATAAPRPHYSVLDTKKIRLTYGVDTPHWFDSLKTCIHEFTH
ncbi:MAG: dTDP-4-dehydrorhamnose reductase [Bacteroides sp.]|nr:dTDP-4-dehydrorhamnose reductase [Bacteroides sp.]MCM1379458.1 dTDP-4-dehydrorhamnose reductase [Bacteroides sp.]MCM1445939.1 dTDP-4-dehydrorhamnose reductase [Prevotella sp.]